MKNVPWQPWYGQENNGIRLFPVPFELTVAASDPCDRFLHVCSAYPLYGRGSWSLYELYAALITGLLTPKQKQELDRNFFFPNLYN
jgi:hypothetical protein